MYCQPCVRLVKYMKIRIIFMEDPTLHSKQTVIFEIPTVTKGSLFSNKV